MGTAVQNDIDRKVFRKEVNSRVQKIFSPVKGRIISRSLQENGASSHSEGIINEGIVIEPTDGGVYAPFDGIFMIHKSKQTIKLVSNSGMILLIQIGSDTDCFEEEFFTVHAVHGGNVRKGQILLGFDISIAKQFGFDLVTRIMIVNKTDYLGIVGTAHNEVSLTDVLLNVINYSC